MQHMKIIIRWWGLKITLSSEDIAKAAQRAFRMSDADAQSIVTMLDMLAAKYQQKG